MKKIIAFILVAILFAMPVLAGWEEDANIGNVKFTIQKGAVAPVLDGNLDWGYTKIPYTAGDLSYAWDDATIAEEGETIAKGLDFNVYATYDANNLYIFIKADDRYYFNEYEDGDGNAWQGSGVQVSAAAQNDSGTDRLEYGIWRMSTGGALGAVVWGQHPNAKAEFTPEANKNYAVRQDAGYLWYETVIPFNTFLDKDTVADGDVVAFNVVIVQSHPDNPGYIHTQLASGCTGNGKTAENLARITLGGAMAAAPAGFEAPEAAAAGKALVTGATFVDGGGHFGDESAENMFDGDTATKYCAGYGDGHFPFYAVWSYGAPVTAERLIIATANDNAQYPRRMADGWTLSGSNDGSSWNVIYTGLANDYVNTDLQYYGIDIPGNAVPYTYFKLNADKGADSGVIQVSEVVLAGSGGGGEGGGTGGGSDAPDQPVVTAPTTPVPQTGDSAMILVISALLALCGTVVFKKAKSVK